MDTEKNQENYIGKALEYDYTKNVTIEVNTAYIEALQRITRYFIMNIIEDVDKVPVMFDKFNKIIKDKKITKETELNEIDRMMYTLYTLTLDLRGKAESLGYVTEVKKESSKEDMLTNLDSLMKKIDPNNSDVDMKRVEQLYGMLKSSQSS
jgi:anti-sigma28 factor (negative regulator of flagellin synthesis)